jgi:hypothetical protein
VPLIKIADEDVVVVVDVVIVVDTVFINTAVVVVAVFVVVAQTIDQSSIGHFVAGQLQNKLKKCLTRLKNDIKTRHQKRLKNNVKMM